MRLKQGLHGHYLRYVLNVMQLNKGPAVLNVKHTLFGYHKLLNIY